MHAQGNYAHRSRCTALPLMETRILIHQRLPALHFRFSIFPGITHFPARTWNISNHINCAVAVIAMEDRRKPFSVLHTTLIQLLIFMTPSYFVISIPSLLTSSSQPSLYLKLRSSSFYISLNRQEKHRRMTIQREREYSLLDILQKPIFLTPVT